MPRLVLFVADDGLLLLLLEGGRFDDECLKEGEKAGGKTDEGVLDWCV